MVHVNWPHPAKDPWSWSGTRPLEHDGYVTRMWRRTNFGRKVR